MSNIKSMIAAGVFDKARILHVFQTFGEVAVRAFDGLSIPPGTGKITEKKLRTWQITEKMQ